MKVLGRGLERLVPVLVVALGASSSPGCGDDGEFIPDHTSPDLTQDEQAQALLFVLSDTGTVDLGFASETEEMTLLGDNVPKDDPMVMECDTGGTVAVHVEGQSTMMQFSTCGFAVGGEGDGVSGTLDGTILIDDEQRRTFEELMVTYVALYGGHRTHNCLLNGTNRLVAAAETVEGSMVETEYNIIGQCDGGTRYSHTGDVIGTFTPAPSYVLDGRSIYTIQEPGRGRFVRCDFRSFNVTTAGCDDFAAACGLDPAEACDSSWW